MNDSPNDPPWWADYHCDPLPHVHPNGFTLDSLSVRCAECNMGKEPDALRVTDSFDCMEVRAAIACLHCRKVTVARMRFYNNRVLLLTDSGWKRYRAVSRWVVVCFILLRAVRRLAVLIGITSGKGRNQTRNKP